MDDNFSVEKFRKEVDIATQRLKPPKNVEFQNITINNMNAEWIIPQNPLSDKVLMYIHGGGFISGSCSTHRMHVAKFANGCRLKTLLFDYRLAPEHPFPAAVEDSVEAYQWLLSNGYGPDDIVVGGESAGGTLTLSLLLSLKEKNTILPTAAFSLSPVTDLRCLADSFTYNARKDIAPTGSWTGWTDLYIAENDPTDPILSPQFGDFTGIPPLFICVGTHEIHYDDCIKVAEVAKKAGVEVKLSVWPRMVHAFPIMAPLFPEATQAMSDICEFVVKHLGSERLT